VGARPIPRISLCKAFSFFSLNLAKDLAAKGESMIAKNRTDEELVC